MVYVDHRHVFSSIDEYRIRPRTTRSSPLIAYVDASKVPDGKTTVAAIFRRHTGEYVGMYVSEVTAQCATRAEYHGVHHALTVLSRTDGADHVVIRTDANPVVTSLIDGSSSWMGTYGTTTYGLAHAFEFCSIEAISRDDNMEADKAADIIRWTDRTEYCSMSGEWLDPTRDLEPAELKHYPPE